MNAVQFLAQLPANGLVTGLHREQRTVMGLEPAPEAGLGLLPQKRGSQKQAHGKESEHSACGHHGRILRAARHEGGNHKGESVTYQLITNCYLSPELFSPSKAA